VLVSETVKRQPDLLQIVEALDALGLGFRFHHRRQEQRGNNDDDGNDGQQFKQRKAAAR